MTDAELAARLEALPDVRRIYPSRPTLGERLTRADPTGPAVRDDDGVSVVSVDLGVAADGSAVDTGLEAVRLARTAVDGPARARVRIVSVE